MAAADPGEAHSGGAFTLVRRAGVASGGNALAAGSESDGRGAADRGEERGGVRDAGGLGNGLRHMHCHHNQIP